MVFDSEIKVKSRYLRQISASRHGTKGKIEQKNKYFSGKTNKKMSLTLKLAFISGTQVKIK